MKSLLNYVVAGLAATAMYACAPASQTQKTQSANSVAHSALQIQTQKMPIISEYSAPPQNIWARDLGAVVDDENYERESIMRNYYNGDEIDYGKIQRRKGEAEMILRGSLDRVYEGMSESNGKCQYIAYLDNSDARLCASGALLFFMDQGNGQSQPAPRGMGFQELTPVPGCYEASLGTQKFKLDHTGAFVPALTREEEARLRKDLPFAFIR